MSEHETTPAPCYCGMARSELNPGCPYHRARDKELRSAPDPAWLLAAAERRQAEGSVAPLHLTLSEQIELCKLAARGERLRGLLEAKQAEWRASSDIYLANAKNRIDAGLGGAYSVASETLRLILQAARQAAA